MSILIGIICPEAIVLASDSQVTSGDGTFRSVDKISVVDFWPGEEVLISQAGSWSVTNRVVEHIKQKARQIRITRPLDVVQVVENSIRETKSKLDKAEIEYLNQQAAILMIAFYVGQKPHLYAVDICHHGSTGIATPATGNFEAAGCGSDLARYLLNEYLEPKSHSDFAIAASIFAIKKVKDTTVYCGGETIIKRIAPLFQSVLDKQYIGKSERIPKDFVNLAETRLIKFDERTKKARDKRVYSILKKTGTELWQKHLEKVAAEEN